jgi:hypothetical protein
MLTSTWIKRGLSECFDLHTFFNTPNYSFGSHTALYVMKKLLNI